MSDFTPEFIQDPAAFLTGAADYLAAEPVLATVIATVAQRSAAADARGARSAALAIAPRG